jgi:hypothetical protein
VIVHIVLFKPKDAITPGEREAFGQALLRAITEIPQVQHARLGAGVQVGVSYEAKLGPPPYSFVAMLEFATVDDLRTYLNHPVHDALGAMFWQTCESTLILDADVVDGNDEIADFLRKI